MNSGFGYDVGVQAVAEVDGINVVTVSLLAMGPAHSLVVTIPF